MYLYKNYNVYPIEVKYKIRIKWECIFFETRDKNGKTKGRSPFGLRPISLKHFTYYRIYSTYIYEQSSGQDLNSPASQTPFPQLLSVVLV